MAVAAHTFRIRQLGDVCRITGQNGGSNSLINRRTVVELRKFLAQATPESRIVVIEGFGSDFCKGADLEEFRNGSATDLETVQASMGDFFELLTLLADGPFISIASVRGQAVAAGLGIAAACDIVIAHAQAKFGLSELLFGMIPACVAPFVMRRVGIPRTKFLALSTLLIDAEEARSLGLVDIVVDDNGEGLRRILARLRKVPGASIGDCKRLFATLGSIQRDKELVVSAGAATTLKLTISMRDSSVSQNADQ